MINKLFCLGISKTGTKSFVVATKELGFNACHNGGRPLDSDLLNEYNSFADSNTCWFDFKELDEKFPNSKFVLTLRDKDAWVKRILEWYNPKYKISYIKWHKYGNYYPQRVDTLGELEYFYEQYQSDIYKYFEDKKYKFTTHDVFNGDGYEKLCNFLEMKLPNKEYPKLKNEKI